MQHLTLTTYHESNTDGLPYPRVIRSKTYRGYGKPRIIPNAIYRVSQEERSIFWKVIVSVILSKNVYMNMCPIPNGFRDRAI